MKTKLYQLDYIVNIEKFQKIQNDIAAATDMAIITIDYKGKPITKHSQCSDFCKAVRENPELSKQCEKCDSRGGLEAARNQEPYIYICHIGIVDFAIPIIVDDQYLGALMAGQVRLKDKNKNLELEHIVSKKYQVDLTNYPELNKKYDALHSMSLDKIKKVAQMMNHIISYIVEEAILKTSLNELNQSLSNDGVELDDDQQTSVDLKMLTENMVDKKSILLSPALKYIDEHFDKKLYVDDMAYLCNISPSYFSKIFKREMGCNFSTYINTIKVSKAKLLLETTDQPIINISLDLGYEDCGYFIKVFKKICGSTPASYRKEFQHK